MPTSTASGSGEPPGRNDYDANWVLPRSGLLEHRVAGEPQQLRFACCYGPLNAGVGQQLGIREWGYVALVRTTQAVASVDACGRPKVMSQLCSGRVGVGQFATGALRA